jgi:hypothetical protein
MAGSMQPNNVASLPYPVQKWSAQATKKYAKSGLWRICNTQGVLLRGAVMQEFDPGYQTRPKCI